MMVTRRKDTWQVMSPMKLFIRSSRNEVESDVEFEAFLTVVVICSCASKKSKGGRALP